MENKDIFEEALETTPEEELNSEMGQSQETTDDFIADDFKPNISDESDEEKEQRLGVKEKANGRVLTIKEVEILSPKTYKMEDGVKVPIPPQVTQNQGAKYYPSKLKIRFEEDNLTEYYPTVAFWLNDGKLDPNVKFDRNGNSKVSQMVRMILQKMSDGKFQLQEARINERPTLIVTPETKEAFHEFSKTISDKAILEFLVGKKVQIETSEGIYNGKQWFRNDIKAILG